MLAVDTNAIVRYSTAMTRRGLRAPIRPQIKDNEAPGRLYPLSL